MLYFKSIKYKNILSVGNKFITIDLNSNDKTLMTGKNGQGKSLLADALTFALYGKAFRKIKKEQMVNSVNRKQLLVELEFNVGNVEYKIIRGIKPNIFKIYIDGKLKKQDASSKDYQTYLEQNILGMSEKTFRQIVILGSTAFVPFMKLTTPDRRAVVENLLDIQVFSYMQQVVKGRASVLTTEYRDLKSKFDLLDNTLELKERHINDMKNKDESKRESNLILIEKYESEISDTRELIAEVSKELIEYEDVAVDATINNKLTTLKGYRMQIDTNIRKFNKDKEFYTDNNECPTCKQSIDSELKTSKIDESDSKIKESEKGLIKINSEIDTCIEYIDEINTRLSKISSIQLRINNLNHEITSNQRLIDVVTADNANLSSTDSSAEELEIIELRDEISELNQSKNKLVDSGNYYAAILDMIKDGGIKAKIIKNYIPVINVLIQKYLKVLDFPINFMFDEQFNETIKARNRDIFSYSNFSEGEKLRIDLCLLFTWREIARMKNSASTNLILFDEIGSNSLDVDGLDAFMRIISGEKDQNVFVISHNQSMVDRFNQVLHFQKVGHFTEVSIK